MKVLLIRRKNQRVSVSYVRVLFVVSQENSVFTLYLFKYGGLLIYSIEIPPLFAEQGQFLFKGKC